MNATEIPQNTSRPLLSRGAATNNEMPLSMPERQSVANVLREGSKKEISR
jgi:hypothetical protein